MSRAEGEQPHQGTAGSEWAGTGGLTTPGGDFVLEITPQIRWSHTEGRVRLQQFTHQAVQVPVN